MQPSYLPDRSTFNHNYAPTWRNNFLLRNCRSPLNGCVIQGSMLEDWFSLPGCKSGSGNISCYSEEDIRLEFVSLENLNWTNCAVLFTSIAVDSIENRSMNSAVELKFQFAELRWWLKGSSSCVREANCVKVPLAGGEMGFRCRCKEGFKGDGFTKGDGCRKVSNCNASGYMSGRCGGATGVGILIGGVVAGACLATAPALIFYCVQRRSTSLKNQMSARRLLSEATGSSAVPLFPYKDIERATNGFSVKQRLGTGAYGTVYAGKLHNDEWVAIKN